MFGSREGRIMKTKEEEIIFCKKHAKIFGHDTPIILIGEKK